MYLYVIFYVYLYNKVARMQAHIVSPTPRHTHTHTHTMGASVFYREYCLGPLVSNAIQVNPVGIRCYGQNDFQHDIKCQKNHVELRKTL